MKKRFIASGVNKQGKAVFGEVIIASDFRTALSILTALRMWKEVHFLAQISKMEGKTKALAHALLNIMS